MTALWSIVLAAGKGRRLSPLTGGTPKQFWAPHAERTLIAHTIDRLGALTPRERTITVIDQSQRHYAEAIAACTPLGRVVEQACDRGTAAGVLRGLAEVGPRAADLILLTPSDHGVGAPRIYRDGIREAVSEIQLGRAEIVLLGAEPSAPAGDYGWIVPVEPRGWSNSIRRVQSFVEKPSHAEAAVLLARGAVWSTMVTVARLTSLVELYRAYLPDLAGVLTRAWQLPVDRRHGFLATRYPELPEADFSHDLLTPATNLHLYTWPAAMGWTDLGTPDRLQAWLAARRAAPRVARSPRAHAFAEEA